MLQDRHGSLNDTGLTPVKSKKTLAEKISRTLDKIAAVTTSPVSGRDGQEARVRGSGGVARSSAHPGAGLVFPVYAGYSPGYRTVRGPHGMSYQYVYTGWDPGLYHQDYHGGGAGPQPHYFPSNTFCRCASSGSESVRTKSGVSKCKKCSKPKTPYIPRPGAGQGGSVSGGGGAKVRARLQLPADPAQYQAPPRAASTQQPGPPAPQGPKDPYDYIRRTRLKADDWDTYWDTEPDTGAKQSPSPGKHSGLRNENKFVKHSRSPAEARRGGGGSQFDPRSLGSPGERGERTEDRRQRPPADIRVTMCDLMEDEDSNQPESKPISNSEPSVRNLNDIQGQSEDVSKTSKEPNSVNNKTETDPDSFVHEDSESGLSSGASLLANMATMDKSKISVAEMRYRKFQRRNPLRKLSLQIDEVIMEEDEEALENEEQDYQSLNYSSLPPLYENEEEKSSTSSDDEFGIGKFRQVIGDSNFADEILSEIYGSAPATSGPGGSVSCRKDCSNSDETQAEEGEREALNRSLADEILDELYGVTKGGDDGEAERRESPEYCNIEDIRGDGDQGGQGDQGRGDRDDKENKGDTSSVTRTGNLIGAGGAPRSRLSRSASLQERSLVPLSALRLLSQDDSGLYHSCLLPELPGTPTLHRPPMPPPPPPPSGSHPLLQPFNSLELSRINNVIDTSPSADDDDDFSGPEFSDDEFDTDPADTGATYDNLPLQRLPPEGAEAASEYDVPELNESFDEAIVTFVDASNIRVNKPELDTSFTSSTCAADISADSLMPGLRQAPDTSMEFDSDSIDGFQTLDDSGMATSGSIIQNHGEKTIILSPAMAQSQAAGESQSESKIFISSSSWINIDTDSCPGQPGVNNESDESRVTIVSSGDPETLGAADTEPVKPPRLKKLARQQSKQEMLRAKGFGLTNGAPKPTETARKVIKGVNITNTNNNNNKNRPEISSPILINSTFNSEDFQKHKCITINRSDVPFLLHAMAGMESESDVNSVYRANSSDTDSSFYNADSVLDDVYSNETAASDIYSEHIYEEIPENGKRPLPPIPEGSAGSVSSKSIFTGATKYEILHYLNDAKQRIEGNASDFETTTEDGERDTEMQGFLVNRNHKHRVSAISNISDSSSSSNESSGSGDGSVLWRGSLDKVATKEVERNDSGVGSDSGMSTCNNNNSKLSVTAVAAPLETVSVGCEDCELTLTEDNESLCPKCVKRRGERKEIITEIVDTEIKYGRDLRIIVEEFYRPMLVAGLLSSDQLASIFLNVEQLIQVNTSFTDKLKEALDDAAALGDEDLFSVQIGILFINAMPMLQAFEAYCTKQAASSMLLANVEREKELLRVFLKVSQMENKILRRMNLSSFLMVPVQRVTKYPLLLARLLKVTPGHHKDRENIREAQARIEAALEQINKDAKEIIAMKGSWRRGVQTPKKMGIQREMNNMRVRKLSLEMLGWSREDTRFALEGRLTFAQVSDSNWKSKLKGTVNSGVKLMTANALLVVTSKPGHNNNNINFSFNNNSSGANGTPGSADLHTTTNIIFPKLDTVGDAVLLLVREKTSRFTTVRDPFFLEKAIICCEQDWEQEYFEIHEFGTKDSYIFKAEDTSMTGTWFQALQFYSQCLGGWRRRRRGLGNIMVDPSLN